MKKIKSFFANIKNLYTKYKIWILLPIICILFLISAIILIYFFNQNQSTIQIILYVLIFLITICFFLSFIFIYINLKRKFSKIDDSINYFFQDFMSKSSIGLIILDYNFKIIWISEFVKNRFSNDILNQDIFNIIPNEDIIKKNSDFQTLIKRDGFYYKINFLAKNFILTVKDVTEENVITNFYEMEKLVIGELEIDNYQEYQSSCSEEELFAIQTYIISLLESLCKKYNFSFKQYINGKFLIFTNQISLQKMIQNNFQDIYNSPITINEIAKNILITFSIGFASNEDYSKIMENAKNALRQSQSRGGNQITIINSDNKPQHFGSRFEINVLKSRTKINNVSYLFKQKLANPEIKKVIIYGHKIADLDAIGSSYAIYNIALAYKKEVYIQNITFDDTAKKAIDKYIPNSNKIFISPKKAQTLNDEKTLVVMVDCSELHRVENPKIFHKINPNNIFIFDHHRYTKLEYTINKSNIYIENTASSASEIVCEMIVLNNFNRYLKPENSQLLLDGIYLDTNQFNQSTSSRTFMAASLLEEWGANIEDAVNILKISSQTNSEIQKMLENIREIKPGYWLIATNDVVPPDVVSKTANEILRIDGRKAAFVIAKQPKNPLIKNDQYKLSARSIDVNVQLIAEAVGGGGHFNSAAAVSDSNANESLETFTNNIIQAIISSKNN